MLFALKGQVMIAQGNALGHRRVNVSALKGRIHRADNAPLQGLRGRVSSSPGRCPGLYYLALSGQITHD